MVSGTMPGSASPNLSDQRLDEIAAHLRQAFAVNSDDNVMLSDLATALDSPELAEIFQEIATLRNEELQRLERLLGRFAHNDR